MGVQVIKQRVGILVAALIVSIYSGPAGAANWFEKTFYMIGPRFDSQLPSCDNSWALIHHSTAVCDQGRPVLELRFADHELRPDP